MQKVPISKVVEWVGGHYQARDGEQVESINSVVIDSRQANSGSLFVALPGENTDGHQFVPSVIRKGGFALVKQGYGLEPGIIEVADPKQALQQLAKLYLAQFPIPVVAVTGSNGKTSTKDFIAAVLSSSFQVHKTAGNFNNEIGLPLTVLGLTKEHEVLVVEMGMRGLGQIKNLTEIAQPLGGVITNIGPVHLELLGSQENIAKAKGELLDALPPHGFAILNGDDHWVQKISSRARCAKQCFGIQNKDCELRASDIQVADDGTISFVVHYQATQNFVKLGVPGVHNVYNALAAVGVGLSLGLSLDQCVAGLNRAELSKMRLEIVQAANGTVILNDAYNASPASMHAALTTLASMKSSGRRVAILGDMYELGDLTPSAHRELGVFAPAYVDQLIYVGRYANYFLTGLKEVYPEMKVPVFATSQEASRGVWNYVEDGDLILVKASRGVALEHVIEALERGREGK